MQCQCTPPVPRVYNQCCAAQVYGTSAAHLTAVLFALDGWETLPCRQKPNAWEFSTLAQTPASLTFLPVYEVRELLQGSHGLGFQLVHVSS